MLPNVGVEDGKLDEQVDRQSDRTCTGRPEKQYKVEDEIVVAPKSMEKNLVSEGGNETQL